MHLDSFQCFEKFIAITGRQNGASCTLAAHWVSVGGTVFRKRGGRPLFVIAVVWHNKKCFGIGVQILLGFEGTISR